MSPANPNMNQSALLPALGLAVLGAAVCAPMAAAQGRPTGEIHRAGTLMVAPDLILTDAEAEVAVRGGRVAFVGREIPDAFRQNARLVDHGDDAWIAPGFVLMHTMLGVEGDLAETIDAFTPDLRAAEAFDPHGEAMPRLVAGGVTTFGFAPSSRNTVAGLAGIVRYDPAADRGTLLEPTSYLKLSLTDSSLGPVRYPTSRMGAAELIRLGFEQARTGHDLAAGDPAIEVLARVAAGETGVVMHAERHAAITTALDLGEEIDLPMLLLGARELDDSLERLPSRAVRGVILDEADWSTPRKVAHLAAKLHERGVPIAFTAESPTALRRTVAIAMRHGLPRDVARAALTKTPAEMLGLDDRVGSLRAGRLADFAVWTGDPVDLTSRARAVFAGGVRTGGEEDDTPTRLDPASTTREEATR